MIIIRSFVMVQPQLLRRLTVVEGLYNGLGSGANMTSSQWDAKIKLLVEASAAVEDALASLLDHHDLTLQVSEILTVEQKYKCTVYW